MKNRKQRRAARALALRRHQRGIPFDLDSSDRVECIHAGMPPHYNEVQQAAWAGGEKIRGPGVTTPRRAA